MTLRTAVMSKHIASKSERICATRLTCVKNYIRSLSVY